MTGKRTNRPRTGPGSWTDIIIKAAEIVESYETGVTLRQLFYRLVSAGLLHNTQSEYGQLSSRTAEARREGNFPALIDRTRDIHKRPTWDSPEEILGAAVNSYRRDRTEGQELTIYLGVEKAGIVEQLMAWYGDYGLPILALGGYSSQTYVDEVTTHNREQGRPSILIYAGDFDPSGMDIDRDFEQRGEFNKVERIALTPEQIEEFDLPPMPGKASDSRARGFIKKYGQLVQVELDALPPDTLRGLYQDAIDQYFDLSTFKAVLAREATEKVRLVEMIGI